LHEGERRLSIIVVLEDRLDFRADGDVLQGVAQQVADHAEVVRMGQLDQDHDVGTGVTQGGVDDMV